MSDKARKIAEEVDLLHAGGPGTKALAPDYSLVGFAGEERICELLGVPFAPEVNGNDGGRDIVVEIDGRDHVIDVKTSRRPHLGMLVKRPAKADLFVFVSYPDLAVWGWCPRASVIKARLVDKGHGVLSYEVPNSWLEPFSDLVIRVRTPGLGGTSSPDRSPRAG